MSEELFSVTETGTEDFIIAALNEKPKATLEEERTPNFHRLTPGDVMCLGVGNMDGERPKPGDRCLLNKMFKCRLVVDGYDIAVSDMRNAHYGKPPSKWARFCLWMIYGPRRWRKPVYYEVVYLGAENT